MIYVLIVVAFGAGMFWAKISLKNDKKNEMQKQVQKFFLYYQILVMWLEMKQKGKSGITYLQRKGIKRMAIYGMGELGERFYEEVKNTDIEVAYVIDNNPLQVVGKFMVLSPEQDLPEVDAIVVTADYYYSEIVNQLDTKVNCPIYSLGKVLGNSFGRRF